MLMKDPKKSVSVILAKMKKPEMKEAPKSENGAELDQNMPMESAAEELLAAIESKSAAGVVEAIRSLVELVQNEMPESEDKPEME